MTRILISSMLSLALVVLLCIALTACGGTSDTGSDSNTSNWNCQYPSSQKTPKILTGRDKAARTESVQLSR